MKSNRMFDMKAKVMYVTCLGTSLYIKQVKKHWWSRWEVETTGLFPVLYIRGDGKYIAVPSSPKLCQAIEKTIDETAAS